MKILKRLWSGVKDLAIRTYLAARAKAAATGRRRIIRSVFFYAVIFWIADKAAYIWHRAKGGGILYKAAFVMGRAGRMFRRPTVSFHKADILFGMGFVAAVWLFIFIKRKTGRKYRKGEEYGSARWGNAKDIAPYIDPDFSRNIILTATERLTMDSRPRQAKYARNKNVLVIGGSGSGKTRFYVKPNLMQLHSSYVVTDPKVQRCDVK